MSTSYRATTFSSGDKIAGLSTTVGMRYRAKRNDWFVPGGTTQVYDRYSFALAGTTLFFGAAHYGWKYREITFNGDIPDDKLTLDLPKNTIVSRWDLASAALSDKDVREQANFDVAFAPPPNGLSRERVVREAGPRPRLHRDLP